MRYEGKLYRPPSEADALILQATIGCSWNHCTYCDMYREKQFRVRPLEQCLDDLRGVAGALERSGTSGGVEQVEKLFVADGDALVMPTAQWLAILEAARALFPKLRRVSSYAMASNVIEKSDAELSELRAGGLSLLYIGPESGDDVVMKRIAKGATFADHVAAAEKARKAGIEMSVIALLGIAMERSDEHAKGTARLVTEMDPAFFSALTVTVVPETPLATLAARGKFAVPPVDGLLRELRTMVLESKPTAATFRTNHASNHLPLGGVLPRDGARIVDVIDRALDGRIPLRPERSRGL